VFGLGHTNANEELVMSGLIHWQAKSQSVVALSTLEAEYIACSQATRESLWLRRMIKEAAEGMAVKIVDGPVPIGCDNQGTIRLITSGVVRQKSKHIDVKYHHVHDEQMKDAVKFQNDYCNSLVSLHSAPTTENPNTMNDADLEKEKGVRFFGEEKGVRVIRNWKRKEGFFVEHVLASCRQA